MAKVTHKDKKFEGRVLGVKFANGEAEVNLPGHLAFFGNQDDFKVSGKAELDKIDTSVENPGAGE